MGLEMITKTKEANYKRGLRQRIAIFAHYLGMKQIALESHLEALEEEKKKNMEDMPMFNQDNTKPEDEVEDEESGVLGEEESQSDLPTDGQGRKAGRPVR